MSTFTRYYIQPTGHADGHQVGMILNKDGSVYNDDMSNGEKPQKKKYQFHAPLMAYESVDVSPHGDEHSQYIDILFTQKKDATDEVVAAFRLHSAEQMESLISELRERMKEFRTNNRISIFDFEQKRGNEHSEQF